MRQGTSSRVHNSMNRVKPELAITFSTHSSPILTSLILLPVFIQSTLDSIECCRSDSLVVSALYRHLVADGYHPWFDNESILPRQDWQREITKALKRSDVVLVCLSSNSINKTGYVQKEIKEVLDSADLRPEGAIFVIPIKLEDCAVPDRLAKWQWVNLFERNGYKQLETCVKCSLII